MINSINIKFVADKTLDVLGNILINSVSDAMMFFIGGALMAMVLGYQPDNFDTLSWAICCLYLAIITSSVGLLSRRIVDKIWPERE